MSRLSAAIRKLRSPQEATLLALAERIYKPNDVNKKPDRYWSAYEAAFSTMRGSPISFLELGVHLGDSTCVFRDYFPHARITGLDIQSQPKKYPTDARFVKGSQDDPDILAKVCEIGAPFDIIIDDAAHIGRLAKASFEYLYNDYLKPGGIYVLEDTTPALTRDNWPDSHPYEPPADNGDMLPSFQYGMPALVKQIMDQMMLTGSPYRIDQHRSVAILYKP